MTADEAKQSAHAALIGWAEARGVRGYFSGLEASLAAANALRLHAPEGKAAEFFLDHAAMPAVRSLAKAGRFGEAEELIDCIGSLDVTGTRTALQSTPEGQAGLSELRAGLATYRPNKRHKPAPSHV